MNTVTTTPDNNLLFGAVKLSELLIQRITGRFRWNQQLGWCAFDGSRWIPGDGGEAAVLTECVAAVKEHAITEYTKADGKLTKEITSEIVAFSSGSTQNHAIKIARGAEGVYTPWEAFDRLPEEGQPYLLHCANGVTVEMHRKGGYDVRPTTPDDLNTKVACAYEKGAEANRTFGAFMEYQPNAEVREFLLMTWARGLSGLGSETFIANLGEGGGNGKGTMQGVLETVAGGYAKEVPVELILKGQNSAREVYRSELAQMRACRLIFCDEPEEGDRYNLGMLKKLTGGGNVQGRGMGKEAIEFTPRVIFQMAANNRPTWKLDGGMKRRYVEVSWDYQIDNSKRDESFKEALKAEASGFLNILLDCWTGTGTIPIPSVVQEQTTKGTKESSPLREFEKDALIAEPGHGENASALYEAYIRWTGKTKRRGTPLTQTAFGREMTERLGYEKKRSSKGLVYHNVRCAEIYTASNDGWM